MESHNIKILPHLVIPIGARQGAGGMEIRNSQLYARVMVIFSWGMVYMGCMIQYLRLGLHIIDCIKFGQYKATSNICVCIMPHYYNRIFVALLVDTCRETLRDSYFQAT